MLVSHLCFLKGIEINSSVVLNDFIFAFFFSSRFGATFELSIVGYTSKRFAWRIFRQTSLGSSRQTQVAHSASIPSFILSISMPVVNWFKWTVSKYVQDLNFEVHVPSYARVWLFLVWVPHHILSRISWWVLNGLHSRRARLLPYLEWVEVYYTGWGHTKKSNPMMIRWEQHITPMTYQPQWKNAMCWAFSWQRLCLKSIPETRSIGKLSTYFTQKISTQKVEWPDQSTIYLKRRLSRFHH